MAEPKRLSASVRRMQILLNELLAQGGATAAEVDRLLGQEAGWMNDLLSGRKAVRPRDLAAVARTLGMTGEALRVRLFAAQLVEVVAPPARGPVETRRTRTLAVRFETSRSLVRDAITRHATREHKAADGMEEPASAEDETVRETARDGR